VRNRGYALDAGCGCNGRFIDLLRQQGFTVEGVDISERMIAFARQRDPTVQFYHADICEWKLPRKYDFITGWDSIWHVPLASQSLVLQKLCAGLNSGGVLIFTTGAVDHPGDVQDAYMGPPMYTATLVSRKHWQFSLRMDVCAGTWSTTNIRNCIHMSSHKRPKKRIKPARFACSTRKPLCALLAAYSRR
jgi:2-polyprenyl-3-methyl-5-hydroxy-6-metoxy-1,4-benzoquinol methylase